MPSSQKQIPIVLSPKAKSLEPGLSLCSTTRDLEGCLASALFRMGLHHHLGLPTPPATTLPLHSTSTLTLPRLLCKKIIRLWVQQLAMRMILFTKTPPPTSISLCGFLIRDRMHSHAAAWGAEPGNARYTVNAVSRQDFNSTLSLMKL